MVQTKAHDAELLNGVYTERNDMAVQLLQLYTVNTPLCRPVGVAKDAEP